MAGTVNVPSAVNIHVVVSSTVIVLCFVVVFPALSVTVNVITLIPSAKEFTEVTSNVPGTVALPEEIEVSPTLIV